MKALMFFGLFAFTQIATANQIGAVDLAKITNNESVIEALNDIKGNIDSLTASVEDIGAMEESHGYVINIDVTGTNRKGEQLKNCGFSVTLLTAKNQTFDLKKALQSPLDIGGSAECNGIE